MPGKTLARGWSYIAASVPPDESPRHRQTPRPRPHPDCVAPASETSRSEPKSPPAALPGILPAQTPSSNRPRWPQNHPDFLPAKRAPSTYHHAFSRSGSNSPSPVVYWGRRRASWNLPWFWHESPAPPFHAATPSNPKCLITKANFYFLELKTIVGARPASPALTVHRCPQTALPPVRFVRNPARQARGLQHPGGRSPLSPVERRSSAAMPAVQPASELRP